MLQIEASCSHIYLIRDPYSVFKRFPASLFTGINPFYGDRVSELLVDPDLLHNASGGSRTSVFPNSVTSGCSTVKLHQHRSPTHACLSHDSRYYTTSRDRGHGGVPGLPYNRRCVHLSVYLQKTYLSYYTRNITPSGRLTGCLSKNYYKNFLDLGSLYFFRPKMVFVFSDPIPHPHTLHHTQPTSPYPYNRYTAYNT